MSPRRGSTPRQTDWLTVSCNVTLTLTLTLTCCIQSPQSLPSSQEEVNKSTPQRSPTQKQRICYYSDRRPAQLYQTSVPLSPHRPTTRSLPAEASQWPPGKILTKPLFLNSLIHSPARIPHCLPAVLQPLPTRQPAASSATHSLAC
jgi:hypothetical protein